MLRWFWRRGVDAYLAATAVGALAWPILGDRGPLGLFNAWAFWLLGPALPVGAFRLATRRSSWARLAAAGWLAGGAALLASRYHWLRPGRWRKAGHHGAEPPASASRAARRRSLRVLSLNVLMENECAGDVVRLIHAERPDVVLLQELEPEMSRQIEAQLDMYEHCHWQCHHRPGGGLGIYSRYPFEISGIWEWPLTRPYAVRATVKLPEGQVDLYNVHLLSLGTAAVAKTGLTGNFRARGEQIDMLACEMSRRSLPALALGDYNMTEGNAAYRRAADQMRDVWTAVGRGPGWTWPRSGYPPHLPVLRLDYCFCSPSVDPIAMRVLYDWVGSDHCPILVEAAVAGPDHGMAG